MGYRNVRLSFGLRCSPTILILGLFPLSYRTSRDKSITYLTWITVPANDSHELQCTYEQLNNIFNPYYFFLQQFITNDCRLHDVIFSDLSIENSLSKVRLLGMQ